MANLRTLGVVATMLIGAAGFTGCAWYEHDKKAAEKRQKQEELGQGQQSGTKPKEKIVVMPPLTQVDCGDTLVFNSKADSIEYNKYNKMAWDNFSKVSHASKEVMDSVVKTTKEKLEPKIQELQAKEDAEGAKLIAKRDKEMEQAENDYKNGKITFAQLEAKKEKIQNQYYQDWDKFVFPFSNKKANLLIQIQNTEDKEFTKHEKADSEAFAKLEADRNAMRAKYTKEVRKLNHPGPLEQDLFNGSARVQYKSKADSIKANEYIARQTKIYAPLEKKEIELQKKIDQLDVQIDKLQDQDKYEQAEKLIRQQEKLYEQLEKVEEQSWINRISADSINQYTKKSDLKSNVRYLLTEE